MRCPVDDETLVMTERHGVEIDYCPKCRGVWLDRGELDKILERAAQATAPAPAQTAAAAAPAAPVPPPLPQTALRGEVRRTEYRAEDRGGSYDDRSDDRRGWRRDDDDDDDYRHGRKRRKRDSFLSDIFDF